MTSFTPIMGRADLRPDPQRAELTVGRVGGVDGGLAHVGVAGAVVHGHDVDDGDVHAVRLGVGEQVALGRFQPVRSTASVYETRRSGLAACRLCMALLRRSTEAVSDSWPLSMLTSIHVRWNWLMTFW